jgi:hypothetical protein
MRYKTEKAVFTDSLFCFCTDINPDKSICGVLPAGIFFQQQASLQFSRIP